MPATIINRTDKKRACEVMVMGAIPPIFTVSDLRYKTKEVFRKLKERPVVLTQRGRPRAVLVDYAAYAEMTERQEALETARDAFLLQRAQETAHAYLPFETLLNQHAALHNERLDLPSGEQDV
jgi:prevent-host-death family protein